MWSGPYHLTGKVVKITPNATIHQAYVEVEIEGNPIEGNGLVPFNYLGQQVLFDKNGKPCDGWSTYECGPYELDDMPFAERKASLEQSAREWEAKYGKK